MVVEWRCESGLTKLVTGLAGAEALYEAKLDELTTWAAHVGARRHNVYLSTPYAGSNLV